MPDVKIEFLGRRDKPPHFLAGEKATLGRGAENDVVFCDTEEDKVVSVRHCRIERSAGGWVVRDLGSSNKLFVNGEEVTLHPLRDQDVIQLGKQGPRIQVTLVDPAHRRKSIFEATQLFLRDKLATRKYRWALGGVGVLCVGLAVLYSLTHKSQLELLAALSLERQRLEQRISVAQTEVEKVRLISRLNQVTLEREKLLAAIPENQRPARSFVEEQVIRLMQRFRETSYAVPDLFVRRVEHFVKYYTENPWGRKEIELGLRNGGEILPTLKALLAEKKLPPEMAYIAFVESKFDPLAENERSGARGMWQLMPKVAREHGLTVSGAVDERTDVAKSSRAARALLLDLVSVFGVRSFMLVLAAYNAGDANIRYRLKKLEDPIEQRDFWTLVRLGLLKEETNNYIPKFAAATIVFENLERFGFAPPTSGVATAR